MGYDKIRNKIDKMIEQLSEKPDLTPQEVKNATDAFCLLQKINEVERGDAMRDQYGETYNGYNSYPQSWVATGPYAMDDAYNNNYGRRMRSSTTGRFMSNNQNGSSYGHSVPDRMVASLEDMMDTAHNDYERQMIQKEIQNIRSNTMM